jgi:glycerol kinase
MDMLLQLQADHLGCTVVRPSELETTALGAALLAGLAEGLWIDLEHIASSWRLDREFTPSPNGFEDVLYGEWKRGVDRSLNWSRD